MYDILINFLMYNTFLKGIIDYFNVLKIVYNTYFKILTYNTLFQCIIYFTK